MSMMDPNAPMISTLDKSKYFKNNTAFTILNGKIKKIKVKRMVVASSGGKIKDNNILIEYSYKELRNTKFNIFKKQKSKYITIEPKASYYTGDYYSIFYPKNILNLTKVYKTPEEAYYKYIKKNPDNIQTLKKEQLLLLLKYKLKKNNDDFKFKIYSTSSKEELVNILFKKMNKKKKTIKNIALQRTSF